MPPVHERTPQIRATGRSCISRSTVLVMREVLHVPRDHGVITESTARSGIQLAPRRADLSVPSFPGPSVHGAVTRRRLIAYSSPGSREVVFVRRTG